MGKERPSPLLAGDPIEGVRPKPSLVPEHRKTRSSLHGLPFAWYTFGFT